MLLLKDPVPSRGVLHQESDLDRLSPLSYTPSSFTLILPLSLKAVVKTGLLQVAFQALNSSHLRCLTVFLPSGESLPPQAQPPTYLAQSCAPNLCPEGGDSFL